MRIEKTIEVIGLGYVGLPLAVEVGKSRPVIGFDINAGQIDALRVAHGATQGFCHNNLAIGRTGHVFCDLISAFGRDESDLWP